ncbi:hypothetical protein OTU49_016275 [Cherax quadricarinatus]|uniref:ER-bound oxygenase mpaB/mpaB'/Rubber oxygenase catalytic domain-containing protein n=1 Tax=Cherax quadricarinatus TaxID=27406 RepID=A0AAW0YCM2_CHEQU|nr:uncharacterized protein LOC128688631 [Cherax quadricarinatus]XP_053632518.1 uncharacterized protein LOC128688631 [Cherax quadricarinatus]XP_053632519.1 uncharacterized protein LOC128688631 [Cherax quadricarinatus]
MADVSGCPLTGISACPVMASVMLQPPAGPNEGHLLPHLSTSPVGDSHLPASSVGDSGLLTSPISSSASVTLKGSVTPSPRMKKLLEGANHPGDSHNPPQPPQWLDRELFDRGREFYKRYLYCLGTSDLLSLVMTLSAERALKPLIYTGRSDTPMKALRRYFSTLLHLITWFTGDVWDPNNSAHKDILFVRSIHCKLSRTFNSSTYKEKVTAINVTKKGHKEPAKSLNSAIRQDLQRVAEETLPLETADTPVIYINQLDMSLTQYAFMGLIVAHPEKLGAGAATEEEIAGLIHFWRGIGWLMGVEDQYNFCSGSLVETKELCLEVERLIFIPLLAKVDWNYEHMATSLMTGINYIVPFISYPAMFRYLAYILDIPVSTFVSKTSYLHSFHYWLMRLTFSLILLVPCLLVLLNSLFLSLIDVAQRKRFKLTMSGSPKLHEASPEH